MRRAAALVLSSALVVASLVGVGWVRDGCCGFRDGCCATSSTTDFLSTGSSTTGSLSTGSLSTELASAPPVGESARTKPLDGRVIVIDPGHQLGNHNFPDEINKQVPAGGFTKPCNTTGTATNGGFPESTFVWLVAQRLRERLVDRGARVVFTRHSNREDKWGPCVDVRGRAGNKIDADLKISIHGDGSYAEGAHGFHVIAPTDRKPWTHDIYLPSRRLARTTRGALRDVGLPVATYTAGGDGLDFRSDLATLNLSDIPTVMVELGNMRNPIDAHKMTTRAGRATYARGLAHAVRRFLGV